MVGVVGMVRAVRWERGGKVSHWLKFYAFDRQAKRKRPAFFGKLIR
jgi:hypothetical protein